MQTPSTEPLILLVDDAPDVGLIVRRYGRQAGCGVVREPTAESAWEFLEQGRKPDLVLLDVNLPGCSGIDLCRRIRSTPSHAHLSVALFSQFQRPQDVVAALEAGTNYILNKDLLAQPSAWQQRIGEIIRPPAGLVPAELLDYLFAPHDTRALARFLNQALCHPPLWQLGASVVHILVRRAWQQVCQAPPGGLDAHAVNDWLAPDGHGIDAERFAQTTGPHVASDFAKALAEQIWGLLGSAASAALWASLVPPTGASEP